MYGRSAYPVDRSWKVCVADGAINNVDDGFGVK